MAGENTLTSAANGAIQNYLNQNLNTCLPGKITKVKDIKRKRVSVKPLIKDKYFEGDSVEFPEITNVPLLLPYDFGDFIIKPPAKLWLDQQVIIIFSQRSLDNYLSTGDLSEPKSTTKFSKSDAFCIPGLSTFNADSPLLDDNDDFEIRYSGGKFVIHEDGQIDINGGNFTVDV